ncbi:MAG: hydroxyacylglutathione hydrolase [Thiotrichales bacterium]|nr:hydroxyacylglutathione hydrolase [Thiotrichales bacterium]
MSRSSIDSTSMTVTTPDLQVEVFPCLTDNYGFLIHAAATGETACVDTPDADAIVRELERHDWILTHILNTHHHWDHAGGNLQLKEKYRCTIIGAANDAARIPGIDVQVRDGDRLQLGTHEYEVRETPGHTSGHIVYYFPEQKKLFAGDTIFSVGCGRLFEGSAAQMWDSLQKIMQLPGDTLIYCAHEYTLNNIEFARSIDPSNPDLEDYYMEVKKRRAARQPTIPTQLARELRVNPFLRPDAAGIVQQLGTDAADALGRFTEIRRRKDNF